MIIEVTFKSPDAVDYATNVLNDDDREAARKVIEKFVKHGEMITVAFDTMTWTATVKEN